MALSMSIEAVIMRGVLPSMKVLVNVGNATLVCLSKVILPVFHVKSQTASTVRTPPLVSDVTQAKITMKMEVSVHTVTQPKICSSTRTYNALVAALRDVLTVPA